MNFVRDNPGVCHWEGEATAAREPPRTQLMLSHSCSVPSVQLLKGILQRHNDHFYINYLHRVALNLSLIPSLLMKTDKNY